MMNSVNALRSKLIPRWKTADFPAASADNRGIVAFDVTAGVCKFSDGTAWQLLGGGGSGESLWSVREVGEFGTVLAPADVYRDVLIASADPENDAALFGTKRAGGDLSAPSVFLGIGGTRFTLTKSDTELSLVLSSGETTPFALYMDRGSGRVSFCPQVPEYADDAAADADALLKPGAFYKLTGGRQIFQKP